jgi:hypothetical protein
MRDFSRCQQRCICPGISIDPKNNTCLLGLGILSILRLSIWEENPVLGKEAPESASRKPT